MGYKWDDIAIPTFGTTAALTGQIAKQQTELFDPVSDLLKEKRVFDDVNEKSRVDGNTSLLIDAIRSGKERPEIEGGFNPSLVQDAKYDYTKYQELQKYKKTAEARAVAAEGRAKYMHNLRVNNGGVLPGAVDKDGNPVRGGGAGSSAALDAYLEKAANIDGEVVPVVDSVEPPVVPVADTPVPTPVPVVEEAPPFYTERTPDEVAAMTPDETFDYNTRGIINKEIELMKAGGKPRQITDMIADYEKQQGQPLDVKTKALVTKKLDSLITEYNDRGKPKPKPAPKPKTEKPPVKLNRKQSIEKATVDKAKAEKSMLESNKRSSDIKTKYDADINKINTKYDKKRAALKKLAGMKDANGNPLLSNKVYNAKMGVIVKNEKTDRTERKDAYTRANDREKAKHSILKNDLSTAEKTMKLTDLEKSIQKDRYEKQKKAAEVKEKKKVLKKDYPNFTEKEISSIANGNISVATVISNRKKPKAVNASQKGSSVKLNDVIKGTKTTYGNDEPMGSRSRQIMSTAISSINNRFNNVTSNDIISFLATDKGKSMVDTNDWGFFQKESENKKDGSGPMFPKSTEINKHISADDFTAALVAHLISKGKIATGRGSKAPNRKVQKDDSLNDLLGK